MATSKKAAVEQTVYLIERGTERLRVTVPSDWKVTFGPIVPKRQESRRGDGMEFEAPHCLRFYEANDKQRAIFTGVTAFRDLSIPVEKMVEKVEASSKSKKDHKGSSLAVEQSREEQWIEA